MPTPADHPNPLPLDEDDGSSALSIASLHVHPIKSCAAIALPQAVIGATGFVHDRQWMLVDAQLEFVTQREHARMALLQPALTEAADGAITGPPVPI